MSATPTGQRGTAGRLLRRIVGRPPEKPHGKVFLTIYFLVFVVGVFAAALSWRGEPSLSELATACVMLSGFLWVLGSLAAYHRWRGELAGDLVRLGGMATFLVGLGLLIAEMALTGSWGWVWWSAFVLSLCIVVAVAGHFYGLDDGSHPEDVHPEGRKLNN